MGTLPEHIAQGDLSKPFVDWHHKHGTEEPTQRYCVVPNDDNEGLPGALFNRTVEEHDPIAPPSTLGPLLTEAQAGIFAFGLNAIASGATLYFGHVGNEILTAYDGPTEGVRA